MKKNNYDNSLLTLGCTTRLVARKSKKTDVFRRLSLKNKKMAFPVDLLAKQKNFIKASIEESNLDVETNTNFSFIKPKYEIRKKINNMKNEEKEKSVNEIIYMFRGESLRQLRKSINLTQDDLHKITGISKPFISEMENGSKNPSDETLKKISEALNVPVNYFDLKAMVLGKNFLSPSMQSTVLKIEPLIEELVSNFQIVPTN